MIEMGRRYSAWLPVLRKNQLTSPFSIDPALWRRCVVKVCVSFVIILMAAVFVGAAWLLIRNHGKPPPSRYYASILAANISQIPPDGEMSPSFVLSLGVDAPPGPGPLLTGGGRCLDRGTVVQVSYGGEPLA